MNNIGTKKGSITK